MSAQDEPLRDRRSVDTGEALPTHLVAVFASTNRKRTITGIGAIFRELRQDRSQTRPIFRHSEAYHHSRFTDAQPLAVIRALEVALERGRVRLQLRSNYYHSVRRPHGYSRSSPWSDPVQIRLKELCSSFEILQFGSLGKHGTQARVHARRAVSSGRAMPLRERASYLPDLHPFEPSEYDSIEYLAQLDALAMRSEWR
ncbi:MAG: hypothetical protein R3B70_37760 [Polyangiaceae bacterium]